MTEPGRSKVERALGAMRDDVWGELAHRRVAKRLDEALAPQETRSRTRFWWAAGIAAAAGLVLLFALRGALWPGPKADVALGSALEPARATLSDGSVVDIDRGGSIRVLRDEPERTRVEVLAGRAEFEVQKRPGRLFVAAVRGVEVRVIGTHFSTELDVTRPPGVVRVRVQRGTVEVAAPDGGRVARLHAGDFLEVSLAHALAAPSGVAQVPVPPSAPSAAAPVVSAAPGVSQPAPLPSAPAMDASKLFEAASGARRAGNAQAAASAYAALLKQFPSDERAGVAALELGRLRMDSLGDYQAAATAFRRAIAAAPSDGIREDALARLVEVLDRLHDQAGCAAEQKRYEARYPAGIHANSVRTRCANR